MGKVWFWIVLLPASNKQTLNFLSTGTASTSIGVKASLNWKSISDYQIIMKIINQWANIYIECRLQKKLYTIDALHKLLWV